MQAERTRGSSSPLASGVATAGLASLQLALERIGLIGPVVLLIALAARLPFLLRADFAVNDGGLFAAMSNDLFANHLALPAWTTYNGGSIPFAYPPLAFYLDATVHGLTGLDMLEIARWLPLIENLVAVVLVYAFARVVLRTQLAALLAGVVFALLPRSYEWMIMGGGLTRALGYALAIACVLQAVYVARAPGAWRTAICAVLAGLALAAHLEEGLFALYSALLALACFGRGPRTLFAGLIVCLGAVLVPMPWWLAVVRQHGAGPFAAASLTSGWSSPDSIAGAIGGFLAPQSLPLSLIGILALVGAGLSLLRGDFFASVWLVAIFVLTPRSAPADAVVPLALLAAVGLTEVVLPAMLAATRRNRLIQVTRRKLDGRRALAAAGLVPAVAGVYVFSPALVPDPHSLDSLPSGERQAMSWIASNSAPDAQFLVLSSSTSWEEDLAGEWFPLLANRPSVLTPQGAEWLGGKLYARRICLFQDIRDVATWQNGIGDLEAWASDRGVTYSDVYVSKAQRGPVNWLPMLGSAERSGMYSVVIDNDDVAVLHRTSPLPARWRDSGQDVVADDCRSLADQGPQAMDAFEGRFGGQAAAEWVAEHNAALPRRPSVTSLLARIAFE